MLQNIVGNGRLKSTFILQFQVKFTCSRGVINHLTERKQNRYNIYCSGFKRTTNHVVYLEIVLSNFDIISVLLFEVSPLKNDFLTILRLNG